MANLRARTSVKWRRYPADVLPLWVAEMDTELARPIAEAIHQTVHRSDTGYAIGEGLAEAVADFCASRWQYSFEPSQATMVPDVMQGIAEVLKLLTRRDAHVVVNSPVYPPFYDFIRHADRRVIEAPLDPSFRIDLRRLEELFWKLRESAGSAAKSGETAGQAAYLLCNPHNPTGTVHTKEELTTIASLARKYGIAMIVDEIHAPIVYDGSTFVPFLSVPGSERAISLMSASKAFNLAGLKAGIAIGGAEVQADLARIPEIVGHGVSHLGVIASLAAFGDGRRWLDGLIGDLDENRRLLGELLAKELPEVAYQVPEGTYLAWLDCRKLDLGPDPAAAFLDRGKIALTSGIPFGTGGSGFARLNFATTPEILAEAVQRMTSAV